MVSMIIILSLLEQSDNIFVIIDSEAFKFEFVLPNKIIFASQLSALAIFTYTGILNFVFAFSILLICVIEIPEISASFS